MATSTLSASGQLLAIDPTMLLEPWGNVTPPPGPTQLAAPVLAAPTTVTSSSAVLSWSAVANASGYEMQRATDAAFTQNVSSINTTATSYTSTLLSADTRYYWRVQAVGDGSTYLDSSYSNVVDAQTAPPPFTGINYTGDLLDAQYLSGNQAMYNAIKKAENGWKNMGRLNNARREDSLDQNIYLFNGGTAASHAFNFVYPVVDDVDRGYMVITGSAIHSATGMLLNGINQDATFFQTGALGPDYHFSVYSRTQRDSQGGAIGQLGVENGGINGLFLGFNGSIHYFYADDVSNDSVVTTGTTGLFDVTRNGLIKRLYRNGQIMEGDFPREVSGRSTTKWQVGSCNNSFAAGEYCFARLGAAWTPAEKAQDYQIIQQLQIDLNRAV